MDLGEWVEDDGYRPQFGDVIFYDWQDSGSGGNTGWPDHVGIVEKVSSDKITVIEGNKSNAVGRRRIKIGAKHIRGYEVPKYASEKSVDDLAQEVIMGLWGNGEERKQRLIAAGYDYKKIQKKVNAPLSSM